MIEVFKHFNTYDKSTLSPSFKPRDRPSRQHKLQLHVPHASDGVRGAQRNSFYHRVAPTWNNLPKEVVEVETTDAFKEALDAHWEDDPLKFNYPHGREENEEP